MLPRVAADVTCVPHLRIAIAEVFNSVRSFFASAFLFLLGLFAMQTTWAQTPAFTSGEWTGSVSRAADGSVETCQATNKRPDEYPRLYIGMDSNRETSLAAADNQWGPWKEGSSVPVRLSVDGREVASLEAEAIDQRALVVAIDRKLLMSTLMDDSQVAIQTARGTTTVSAAAVAELFVALESCIASPSHSSASIREAPDTDAVTVLTCEFGNRNSGRESLSCNNLTGFSLECEGGASASTASTITMSFDEKSKRILGRGAVKRLKFTNTEISWEEFLGKDEDDGKENWRIFKIERFSGAITMYGPSFKYKVAKKVRVEDQMVRLATGTCQVVKDRMF
jgi:hypothetical protein